uniref:hypothetical protein n=1 Tax=Nonomuraea gerenzanensis TaxID=93944 RepID=UPI00287FA880|nr:hypothetical protein [Nonomuraea gerenzanensis]
MLAQPMISSPLTAADCCLVTDGGAALVLITLERARDLRPDPRRRARLRRVHHPRRHGAAPDLLRTGTIEVGRRAFVRVAWQELDDGRRLPVFERDG